MIKNYLKGIVAGIGGVAPGLSGSVLLIIMGLYQRTLEALGTLLTDFKRNIRFLLPVVAGMITGVLLFSKVVDFCLVNFEMPTRFCFLGLIVGTVPLFYKEVKKEGFSAKFYLVIAAALIAGTWMFTLNPNVGEQISVLSFPQAVFLGVVVAATAIVPGLDPAVLLSSLGYYEVYVRSLADLDLQVLLIVGIGLAVGAVVISFVMSKLFQKCYTLTFSVIFGVFLSMIPNMLNKSCMLGFDGTTAISLLLMIVGFYVSFYLGDVEANNKRLRKFFGKGM